MIPGLKLGSLPAGDRRRRLLDRLGWLPVNILQAFSFAVVCLVLIPAALLVHRLTANSRIPLWMAHGWWGPIVVGGGLARLRVSGRQHWKPHRSCLVVCNHQSYFDIPVLYSALPAPIHFLGLNYLADWPGIGQFGRAVGTIYLSRHSPYRSGKAVGELRDYLLEGKTTVIFPEGTRTRDGRIGPFSPILLAAAIEAGVDILPVAIDGSHRVMPRGGSFLFRPAVVEVRIGKPIPTAGLTASDRRELAGRVRESVCALHEGGTGVAAVSADCPAVVG